METLKYCQMTRKNMNVDSIMAANKCESGCSVCDNSVNDLLEAAMKEETPVETPSRPPCRYGKNCKYIWFGGCKYYHDPSIIKDIKPPIYCPYGNRCRYIGRCAHKH